MEDCTSEYNSMIQSFSADFELSLDDANLLNDLKGLIENKNAKMLKDIDLLSKLAFNIRTGRLKIVKTQ